MKKQKINIVAYSEKDSDQWFSCDKKEFEQIISANNLLAKENEDLEHQLAEKDEEIAELEREVEEYKQQCYDCKHLHKKLELNIKNKLIGDVENLKADLKSQKLLTEIYMAISGTRAEKKDYEKVIRHEICEKIRKNSEHISIYKDKIGMTDCYAIEEIVLDEIEAGEKE